MKRTYWIGIIVIVIILVGSLAFLFFGNNYICSRIVNGRPVETSCVGADFNNAKYCYTMTFGMPMYNGTFNKICSCDGILISLKCPPFAICDSKEVRCFGNIVGMKYIFTDGGNYRQFDTLYQYIEYCGLLTNTTLQNTCLNNANELGYGSK